MRYPLKRVGKRGEGKWQRISWDQALEEVADKTIDVLTEEGPNGIIWDEGSAGSNLGVQRTGVVLDTPIMDIDSEFGDHHPGAAVTCGKISFASSADDLFYSDLILIWGGNPTYTQIPNAHFINEARYNGARIVAITPDYNASAVHADAWIPLNIASDAAFGLALAQVIVEEGIYSKAFIQEQTDMPLLVRKDTGLFLRASDIDSDDKEDRFFVYDQAKGQVTQMAHKTLDLKGLDPALEGEYEVETVDGSVTVTPVFALLRHQLGDYTPEKAEMITGTHPDEVRDLARQIANAKAATIITQSNFGKFYHGLEMERAQFLVFALTGQFGKKGSGINGFPMMTLSGHEGLIAGPGSLPPKVGTIPGTLQALPDILKMVWDGHTSEMITYELMRKQHSQGHGPSSTLFQYYHAGLSKYLGGANEWDDELKRSVESYIEDAFGKGWQQKPPEKAPKIFFEVGGNYLGRNRGYQHILSELFPKLDMVVTLDWRMSYTAMHSDYVLPAAGYYEQDSVPWTTPIVPFTHATVSAVEPLGESKSDWAFHCLLMKKLQERA
ncbi:MAG: molybdopterin-dependent oxidoreductase [Gammaproteobacteria bacterium]|nr:molybdopterin-dependent oxidoreductase [Gammaproteobacteria bacterium]